MTTVFLYQAGNTVSVWCCLSANKYRGSGCSIRLRKATLSTTERPLSFSAMTFISFSVIVWSFWLSAVFSRVLNESVILCCVCSCCRLARSSRCFSFAWHLQKCSGKFVRLNIEAFCPPLWTSALHTLHFAVALFFAPQVVSQIKDMLNLCTQHRQTKTLAMLADVTSAQLPLMWGWVPPCSQTVILYYCIGSWIGDVVSRSNASWY